MTDDTQLFHIKPKFSGALTVKRTEHNVLYAIMTHPIGGQVGEMSRLVQAHLMLALFAQDDVSLPRRIHNDHDELFVEYDDIRGMRVIIEAEGTMVTLEAKPNDPSKPFSWLRRYVGKCEINELALSVFDELKAIGAHFGHEVGEFEEELP